MTSAPTDPAVAARVARRSLLLVLLIAAVVLIARGLLISHAQNERYDDEYHLNRGVAFWRLAIANRPLNDPPLGEALSAVPLALTGSVSPNPMGDAGLYGHRLSPQTLLDLIAVWKSLLFLPLIAVAFLWVRELYGHRAAWAAAALLLIEPTFAAHIPAPAVDVLGAEGIVIACFALWKYHQRPTLLRLSLAALAVAAAMLMKNTAIILPGVAFAFAGLWWVVKPIVRRESFAEQKKLFGRRTLHVVAGGILLALSLWAMTLFDISTPIRRKDVGDFSNKRLVETFRRDWPAGTYLRSALTGVSHATSGHPSFLNGKKSRHGRWDYFPTVASYKLPLGIMGVLGVGLASLAWRRPRFDEWSLAMPAFVWTAMLLHTEINIGFRHFLPALAFLLLLSVRALADGRTPRDRLIGWIIGLLLLVAWVETLASHPNYLSYVNVARRHEPFRAISDSNLDWGQSLKALRTWAARQDRPVSLAYFGSEVAQTLEYYLADTKVRVVLKPPFSVPQPAPLPTSGLFVVSPTCLVGAYDKSNRLKPLWDETPIETIDGALLVYDLDAIAAKRRIKWPAVK